MIYIAKSCCRMFQLEVTLRLQLTIAVHGFLSFIILSVSWSLVFFMEHIPIATTFNSVWSWGGCRSSSLTSMISECGPAVQSQSLWLLGIFCVDTKLHCLWVIGALNYLFPLIFCWSVSFSKILNLTWNLTFFDFKFL